MQGISESFTKIKTGSGRQDRVGPSMHPSASFRVCGRVAACLGRKSSPSLCLLPPGARASAQTDAVSGDRVF